MPRESRGRGEVRRRGRLVARCAAADAARLGPRRRNSASRCRGPRSSNSSATRPMPSCSMPACSACAHSVARPIEVDIEPLLETARLAVRRAVGGRAIPRDRIAAGRRSRRRCSTSRARSSAVAQRPRRSTRSARSIDCKDLIRRAPADLGAAPTTAAAHRGTHYRIADEQAEPIRLNSTLGPLHQFRESHGPRGRGRARGLHARRDCPSACH